MHARTSTYNYVHSSAYTYVHIDVRSHMHTHWLSINLYPYHFTYNQSLHPSLHIAFLFLQVHHIPHNASTLIDKWAKYTQTYLCCSAFFTQGNMFILWDIQHSMHWHTTSQPVGRDACIPLDPYVSFAVWACQTSVSRSLSTQRVHAYNYMYIWHCVIYH